MLQVKHIYGRFKLAGNRRVLKAVEKNKEYSLDKDS